MNKFLKAAAATTIALSLFGCGASTEEKDDKTLTIGATSAPHAIILEEAAKLMEEEGYTLEIKEFSDYPQINPSTSDGSLDANYFQHQPYLTSYNADEGFKEGDEGYLVSAGAIHYEPLGAYSKTIEKISLDTVKDGDQIVVPNDATNEARALLLLQDLGLIKLNDEATLDKATVKDIVENPKNLEIVEISAEQTAYKLDDVAIAVVNGNYALTAEIDEFLRANESSDSEAAQTYQNVIAVREEDKDDEAVKELVKVLKSDEIKAFIEKEFGVAVVPAE